MVMFTDPRAFVWPTRITQGAAVGATLLAAACPVAVVPSLIAAAMATATAAVMTVAAEKRRRPRTEMVQHRWFDLTVDELPDMGPDWVYVGEGYRWEERHRKQYKDLIATKSSPVDDLQSELIEAGLWPADGTVPAGRSPSDIADMAWRKEGGDPRIMALGYAELRSVYIKLETYAQHCSVYGATGVGKSRSVETLISHCIRHGISVACIDPKGDPGLTDLTSNLARIHGRHYGWVSLANPRESGTFNTMSYDDPAELMTRISAVVPPNESSPFWSQHPAQIAGATLIFQAYLRQFLQCCGSVRDHLAPVHRVIGHAAGYARAAHRPIAVSDIERAWAAVASDGDPAIPSDDHLYRLTSHGQCPLQEHIYTLAVEEPRILVAYAAKCMHPGLFLGADIWDLPAYERARTKALQANNPKAQYTLDAEAYFKAKMPMEEDWVPSPLPAIDGSAGPSPEVLRALWAPLQDRSTDIRSAITKMRGSVGELITVANQKYEDRTKYCAMLQTGLSGFCGRHHILNAVDPDIDLRRLIANGEVAYFCLSTLKYAKSAAAVSKMIVSSLAALAGSQIAQGATKVKRCLVVIDEIAAFAQGEQAMLTIMQQARSAGLMMVLMGQTRSALQDALGGEGAFRDCDNNQKIKWQLQTTSRDEAKAASAQFLRSTIEEVSGSISTNPSVLGGGNAWTSMFSAGLGRNISKAEVDSVPEDLFLVLPKGVGVVKLEDGLPWVVQCPRIVVPNAESWYQRLKLPLSDDALLALQRDGKPIPDWHVENLQRQQAADAADAAAEAAAAAAAKAAADAASRSAA